jgi:hypothetical protein
VDELIDEKPSFNEMCFRWLGSTQTELIVYRLNHKELISRPIKVFMIKLGPHGCEFQSYMNIPLRDDVEWLLKQQMGSYMAHLNGVIVSSEQAYGWWTYEMKWTLSGFAKQSFEYRLNAYMQTVLVNSPHILSLYRAISERNDGEFRHLDVSM